MQQQMLSPVHHRSTPLQASAPLEGLQSPELLASISPGTPADITLQQIETHGPPPSARAVGSPSGQEGLQSPELLPTMSPGTPAQHTVHHTDAPSSLPGAAVETQGEMTMQSAWTPVQSAGAAPCMARLCRRLKIPLQARRRQFLKGAVLSRLPCHRRWRLLRRRPCLQTRQLRLVRHLHSWTAHHSGPSHALSV